MDKKLGQNWPEILGNSGDCCMRFDLKQKFLQRNGFISLAFVIFSFFIKIRAFWDVLQLNPLRFCWGKTSLKLKCSKIFQKLRHMLMLCESESICRYRSSASFSNRGTKGLITYCQYSYRLFKLFLAGWSVRAKRLWIKIIEGVLLDDTQYKVS